ncbi:hypothetical protein Cni_G11128 [Canna indica]|uniref:Uncharacterized protein n=1 Tax=Canna indica TaxID=4628 RepID=A0AAQ3K630_9LILI|nr:hypothetical protein Cni_G11128 [Canna indica]
MGREAMNAPRKLDRRTSKETLVKKSEVNKKKSPRNPLKELNGGAVLPYGSCEASKGGCFRFLLSDSSAKESLTRSKLVSKTPRSAPPNSRNVALNSKNLANPSRHPTFQKNASKSKLEVPTKQLGSRKPSKPRTSDLQLWNKRKPSSNVGSPHLKLHLGEAPEGAVSSCLASSPERTHLCFDAHADFEAAKEGEQKLTSTPTSATTPPVQASISPEVPLEASAVAATPVCFAAGHVVSRVQDRRKCRPRGILTIGESDLEIDDLHGGVTDQTRVSGTPPLLAGASIHWLSSPSENANSGFGSSFNSTSRVCVPHCPAEVSVDRLLPSSGDGKCAPKDEFVTTPDHGFWSSSPDYSSKGKSPQFRGLLSFNASGLESTPSSGIGIQKTPTTGGSVSPFSLILGKIKKASKTKLLRSQQERRRDHYGSALENSPFSDDSLMEGLVTPPSYLSSTKKYDLSECKMDAMAGAFQNTSLIPETQMNDTSCQTASPGLNFQFRCLATPSNSVDLNHFQNPSSNRISAFDNVCAKDKVLPSSETRISWREGLVSRIFEMGELDCCQGLSDDEDNSNHLEEDKIGSIDDVKFDNESTCSILKNLNEHIAAAGFGSVEFVLEAEKNGTKVPPAGPISCAESISMESLLLDSSNDSDWKLFYKNHLFEV